MRYLAFKRSDIAHGRVRSIDTTSAEAMHGVEAVFTGAHIAGFLVPMPIGTPCPSPEHRAVAVDTVRFVGDPVAVIVASDRYVARDVADAVVVDYALLPAVVDPAGGAVVRPAHAWPGDVLIGTDGRRVEVVDAWTETTEAGDNVRVAVFRDHGGRVLFRVRADEDRSEWTRVIL